MARFFMAFANATGITDDFARLLPAAAILGGGYLLLIDTLARTMAQVEIPLGILTALIGTPFFIWLLASVQKNWS
jgi:iron complex transport system permease protein